MQFPDYIDIANADIERDKWVTPTLLPIIEEQIEQDSLYKEQAKREIALFKEKINFDELCREYENEKRTFFESSAQLKKQ